MFDPLEQVVPDQVVGLGLNRGDKWFEQPGYGTLGYGALPDLAGRRRNPLAAPGDPPLLPPLPIRLRQLLHD